jgi:hypothetical protein
MVTVVWGSRGLGSQPGGRGSSSSSCSPRASGVAACLQDSAGNQISAFLNNTLGWYPAHHKSTARLLCESRVRERMRVHIVGRSRGRRRAGWLVCSQRRGGGGVARLSNTRPIRDRAATPSPASAGRAHEIRADISDHCWCAACLVASASRGLLWLSPAALLVRPSPGPHIHSPIEPSWACKSRTPDPGSRIWTGVSEFCRSESRGRSKHRRSHGDIDVAPRT